MKNARIGLWVVLVFGSLFLVGCGKGSTTDASACGTGQVYSSSYGCLYQSSCSAGYGLYNGSCVLATSTTSTSGCIALNQAIPFYGSSLQIDSSSNLYGGTIPNSTTYGSMVVGSTASIAGTTFSSVSTGSTYSVGTFQMTVQSSSGYYTGATAAVSGTLTIGAAYQQLIQNAWNTSYGAGTTACVSGIAISGHLYSTTTPGFGGNVYLYLNGSTHGYTLTYY